MKNSLCQLAAFLMAVSVVIRLGAETSPAFPNIVIIFCDDLGYADIGKFGAEGYQTPNLDRLADEGGTRVPCLMCRPGKIPAGTDTGDMLMTIDLFPTIAKLIGAQLPAAMSGPSFPGSPARKIRPRPAGFITRSTSLKP